MHRRRRPFPTPILKSRRDVPIAPQRDERKEKTMKTQMRSALLAFGTCMLMSASCLALERPEPPSVIVESVKFRQRYPWNGLVDIDAKIACSDPVTNLAVYVAAWDNVKDRALTVKTIWVDGDTTKNPDPVVKSGSSRLVWDARADNPGEISDNVSISVQAYVRDMRYLVVDLSGGTNATEFAYSFLPDPPEGGWTDEYKTEKLVLRFIPAGTFLMGSPEDEVGHNCGYECIETQHKVTLTKPFYMGVFEITAGQYGLITGSGTGAKPRGYMTYNEIRGAGNGASWPANSLVDSSSFMGRIRKKTGLCFDLPTEAQWEYACRAGTVSALNNGKNLTAVGTCDNLEEICRYAGTKNDGRGDGTTSADVGSYSPNAWGLYDMVGNVSEWCRDWLVKDLGREDAIDPAGPAAGTTFSFQTSSRYNKTGSAKLRVMRGGNWKTSAQWQRSSLRTCCSNASGYGDERNYTAPQGEPYFYQQGSNSSGVYGEMRFRTYYSAEWGFRVVVLPDDEMSAAAGGL